MGWLRWIELPILISIFLLQVYAYIYVFPAEKEIYEKCELKLLCQLNKIDNPLCEQFNYDIPQDNIPQDIVVNISIGN